MKSKIIPQQIINRVKNTFQNPFDRDRFLVFVRDLFNSIDERKAFHARGYVPEKYKRVIKTYERLATYTDPQERKIDILAVYIQRESSLEYARTTLRNFVADYLKTRGEKDAALVAFVPPKGEDWRFSLVKMEYRYDENKKKIKERLTPAKRYSFLVGKYEKTHTAQSRLSPLVADDEHYLTLEELEEAFSVERVTREFFNKYRELFLETKEKLDDLVMESPAIRQDFEKKNIDTGDFTKKLLGQIVFLYFLQRKGWFGVKRGAAWGTGSRNFLRELFEKKHGNYNNFFNDVLEPLFYQALRYDRSSDDDYFSQFDCRIPFLNGGLFDPINNYDWVNVDIELPDELFSNSKETKEGDTGSGILDIFDHYNFTVKEDEPLEKEVAVDPEMLGKVFENLLEVKDRKSKGTYYTPREIVHYMCRESLINYLTTELESEVPRKDIETLVKLGEMGVEHDVTYVEKKAKNFEHGKYSRPNLPKSIEKHAELIDEKLQNIRICDPAVGSGAFLVGMMQEVVRARNALTPHIENKNERTTYSFKRHAIQNCLYGVDIDPGAVEICKLRLWLSLIVDEEDIKQIKPLPNLDYKVVCGNSLLGVEKNLLNYHLFNKLEQLKPLFFNEINMRKKQEYKDQIDELINQITNGRKDFDFEVYFSEVFHEKKGFDVVIANPPYLEARSPEFSNKMKDEAQLGTKTRWGDDAEYITRGSDLLIYFFETGIYLLSEKGTLVFLTQNSWLDTDYGKKFQFFLLRHTNVKAIIDSDFKYFDSKLGPNINTVISIFFGKRAEENNTTLFARYHDNFEKINYSVLNSKIIQTSSKVEVKEVKYKDPILKTLKWGTLLFSSNEALQIIYLLEAKGRRLNQLANYNLSIGQGLNLQKSFIVDEKILHGFPFLVNRMIPFMTTDDGTPFVLEKTKKFIINGAQLDRTKLEKLKNAGIRVFRTEFTSKIKPFLILPRGISKHFCAMNEVAAYSSSYVDIYDNKGNLPEEIKLNLWLFLNSSVAWLIREIMGRKSLGGGLLKAEATDLREIPIYFEFGRLNDVRNVYEKLKKRQALSTIDEIDTNEHKIIDEIVFDFLEVSKRQKVIIVELLKKCIIGRITKSKT